MRVILMTILAVFLSTASAHAELRFIEKVIDGQTLKLMSGERVQLIGLEINEGLEKEAAHYTRNLVSGSVVLLEYDVETHNQDEQILAYVWFEYPTYGYLSELEIPEDLESHYVVDHNGEGRYFVFLNASIIKAGFANPSEEQVNSRHAELFHQIYEQRDELPALVQAKAK